MSSAEDVVLQKVQKLLALAARAGTEEEAALANEKAHELLSKYNLSIVDLKQKVDTADVGCFTDIERYNEEWRRRIVHAVADLYFCRYMYSKTAVQGKNSGRVQLGVKHMFIGRKHNATVAVEMSRYLVSTVNRLANEGSRVRLNNPTSTERGRYVNSFRLGAAIRLSQRMARLKADSIAGNAKAADGSNLPATLDLYDLEARLAEAWLKNMKVNPRQAAPSQAGFNSALGAQDGNRAAEKISLQAQVKNGNKAGTLISGPRVPER